MSVEDATAVSIYVLELEKHKYYVGKASDVEARFVKHRSGSGAAWTKVFAPVRIVSRSVETSLHDEENTMLDYCCRFGIENVRGGSFSSICPTLEEARVMLRRVRAHLDLCYSCGLPGHVGKQCPRQEEDDDSSSDESSTAPSTGGKNLDRCFRCGRAGHWRPQCYAKTDAYGVLL